MGAALFACAGEAPSSNHDVVDFIVTSGCTDIICAEEAVNARLTEACPSHETACIQSHGVECYRDQQMVCFLILGVGTSHRDGTTDGMHIGYIPPAVPADLGRFTLTEWTRSVDDDVAASSSP